MHLSTASRHPPAVPDAGPIRPFALRPGRQVAIVSPAWCGPYHLPEAYRRALVSFEGMGYQPVPTAHATDGWKSWTSAPAERRADDVNQAFADRDIDAILCSIGGGHSAQLLPHLDFESMARSPKPFCGYSDVTSLHHALHAATGMVTFYGPALIPQWGAVGGPLDYSLEHFERVLGTASPAGKVPRSREEVDDLDFDRSESRQEPLRRRPPTPRRPLRPGCGEGPLLAGCLPATRTVLGTRWQPEYDERVLVLDIPTAPYSAADADADLTHLRLAGCLDRLAALIVSRGRGFSDGEESALHEVLLEQTGRSRYPVLASFEGGHSDPMPTWPIGVWARVSDAEVELLEPAVRDQTCQPERG
jgi:muramoyltetrapeptide carboxypeptidase